MDIPPPPIPRFKVNTPAGQVAFDNLTAYLEYLTTGLKAGQVQPGVGVRLDRSPTGTVVMAKPSRARSAGTSCPFDGGMVGADFRFSRLGFVNGGMPVNMFDGDALWSVEVTSDALGFIVLEVLTDGNVVTSSTIVARTEPVVPPGILEAVAPASFDVLLYAIINRTAIRAWGCGNVQADSVVALTTQSASAGCGANPDVLHYTWELSPS